MKNWIYGGIISVLAVVVLFIYTGCSAEDAPEVEEPTTEEVQNEVEEPVDEVADGAKVEETE